MRLDRFLKLSRLCPRRSVAQKLCDAGVVFVNGHASKSGHSVKPGDEISIRKVDRETRVRVLEVPAARSVSRPDSKKLIEVVNEVVRASPCTKRRTTGQPVVESAKELEN